MARTVDKIQYVSNPDGTSYLYYPVAIIGGGESGIAMGCRLRSELGFDQFRIFERMSGLGGTWYANTYPGIACDVPALLYSYSFAQSSAWTSVFPAGKEIVRYLADVCAKYEILDKIQLDTSVKSIRWLDREEEWELVLEHLAPGVGDLATHQRVTLEQEKGKAATVLRTEIIRAKVVASAVGGLVEPKKPIDFPGIDTFEGDIVHTGRWDKDVDFRGKNVVVVGTGCSAAPGGPTACQAGIRCEARYTTNAIASWVAPTVPDEQVRFLSETVPKISRYIPGFQNALRKVLFSFIEAEFISLFSATEAARKHREAKKDELLAHMHKYVPKEYQEILTPDYEVFCKRRVIDEGWFKSLQHPDVELTTLPLTSVQPKSVTLGPGRYYPPMSKTDSKVPTEEKTIPTDIIVMANGYETNIWLHPLDVTGRNGKSLYKTWEERGGAQAYLGTAMDGFPNFFLIFGPNTATGHSSVILASENMVNYSLNFIKPILRGDVSKYEVKESAERKWTKGIQDALKNSVFQSGGCNSWYFDKNGWNSTVYPWTQIDFTLRCMFPRWSHWQATYTRKGLVKLTVSRLFKLFALVGTLYGAYFAVKNGTTRTKDVLRALLFRGRESALALMARVR